MTTSVIIDLVIVAVFVLCVVLGARRGLFRSLAELAVVVAALLCAAWAADLCADLIVEQVLRPATEAAVEQRVDEMMAENILAVSPQEEMERVLAAIPNDFVREQAEKLLGSLELSTDTVPGYSARDVLLSTANALIDTVLTTVIRNLVYTLAYLICFLLLTILLRWAVKLLDIPFRLPLLRQANWIGGVLFGAVKGVLLLWLVLWFLFRTGLLLTPEIVEKSIVLKWAVGWAETAGYPVV